ncbi:uncharacterized protein [Macrobrachium rosenbergii]|uniref:uncharacterized protein n=1 Tax=Macrobrachium rosenbergii TaxID=79674 RepID=UPI0034D4F7AC
MAYNLTANGMVERAHRSLKAALMAHCTDERWKEQLLWVLLGLRTAQKQMATLPLLRKPTRKHWLYPENSSHGADTSLPRLRELAQRFLSCHKTFTDRTITYSSPALHSCACVFVRADTRRPPLTRPYRWPHRVIKQASKAFLLDTHRREDWITIDRLKPSFLLDSEVCEEVGRRPSFPTKAGPGAAQKMHPAIPRC